MTGKCAECRHDSHDTCQQWIDLPEEGCCCGANQPPVSADTFPRLPLRKLLVFPDALNVRAGRNDGVGWITDGAVLGRSELFPLSTPPERPLTCAAIRRCLSRARTSPDAGRVQCAKLGRGPGSNSDTHLVHTNTIAVAINARVWEGWSALGLEPHANLNGQVLWYRKVRGRLALYGIIEPVLMRVALGDVHRIQRVDPGP